MIPVFLALSFLSGPQETKLVEKIYSLETSGSQQVDTLSRLDQELQKASSDDKIWKARYITAELLQEQKQYYSTEKILKVLSGGHPDGDTFLEASAQMRLAENLFLQGQYVGSYEQYLEVRDRKVASLDGEAMLGLAASALAYGDPDTALVHVTELLDKQGDFANNQRLLFPIGLVLYQNGMLDETIGLLGEEPSEPDQQYLLGLVYRRLKALPKSLSIFEKVARNFPNTPWAERAAFEIAETYYLQGEHALARRGLEEWLTRYPFGTHHNQVLCRLAALDFMEKHFTDAKTRLARIDPSVSDSASIDLILAQLKTIDRETRIQLGDLTELSAKLENELKLSPEDTETIYQAAWARTSRGDNAGALTLVEGELAKKLSPEWQPAYLSLAGYLWQKSGNDGKAMAAYQTVIDRYFKTPWAPKALHLMTVLLAKEQDYERIATQVRYWWQKMPKANKKDSTEVEFWLGEALAAIGKPKAAMEAYQRFLFDTQEHRLEPYARLHLAAALAQCKRTEQALRTLQELEKWAEGHKSPLWSREAKLQAAAVYFQDRKFEQSVWQYRALRTKDLPADLKPVVLHREALGLARLKYFADALDLWNELARDYPTNPLAEEDSFTAARTLFELGQSTRAVQAYSKFLTSYPSSPKAPEALLQLGHVYYNSRDYTAAIPHYVHFLTLYPESKETKEVRRFLQACLANTGRSLEEILPLAEGEALIPEVADKLWQDAAKAYNAKDHAKAEILFHKMLQYFPESSQTKAALFFRAECLFALERTPEALNAYRAFLNTDGDQSQHATALFRLGVCQFKLKKFDESAASFENFLSLHPHDALSGEALENLPLAYLSAGQLPKVHQAYERLLASKTDPKDRSRVLFQWGAFSHRQGNFDEAQKLFQQIPTGAAEKPQALQLLADIQAKELIP